MSAATETFCERRDAEPNLFSAPSCCQLRRNNFLQAQLKAAPDAADRIANLAECRSPLKAQSLRSRVAFRHHVGATGATHTEHE
jgi:hypothetical protein